MSQAVLCIGLGDFGEQCLHQIQDWISPSSKIDTSTYRKFLEHNSEYWGFISRSPEFEEDPFLIDDLMQPTVAGQEPKSMIQFKEVVYHSLVRLLQRNQSKME